MVPIAAQFPDVSLLSADPSIDDGSNAEDKYHILYDEISGRDLIYFSICKWIIWELQSNQNKYFSKCLGFYTTESFW